MQKYLQFDLQNRHQFKAMPEAGHTQTKIDEIIEFHKSTSSREISSDIVIRGLYANDYRPER